MKRPYKILVYALLSFGLAALSYEAWRFYQDQQTLKQIQTQERAIARYSQETKQRPQDPQAYLNLGNAAMTFWENPKNRLSLHTRVFDEWSWLMAKPRILNEATAAYTTALKLDPTLAEAQIGLCNAMVEQNKQGQEATVTTICRKAVQLNPQSANSYLALGVALSRQKQWPEAEATFRKYLPLTENQGNAYYQLGKALLAQQKYDAAEVAYRQAIQLGSRGNLTYEGLGDALIEQEKPEEAIAVYRKCLDVEPSYPPAYVKLGDSLIQKKRFEEAISTYRELVQRYPTLPSGYSGLGRALIAQQKWDEAIAAFNKAIELDNKNSWTFMDRGEMFAQRNKLDQAITDYSKAIQLEPTNIFAFINRGVAYARQGNPKSALVDLNRAVQLEPNSEAALSALCWNGSLLDYAAQVISACEKVVAVANPQDKDLFRDSRGLARAMIGNEQGAITDLQAFIQWTTSKTARAYYDANDLHKRSTKRQRWIQDLQNHRNPFTPKIRQELLTE